MSERDLRNLIRERRIALGNQYAFVGGDGRLDAESHPITVRIGDKKVSPESTRRLTRKSIEQLVRELQKDLYLDERKIAGSVFSPLAVLDPERAARHIGVNLVLVAGLSGSRLRGKDIEVAGQIDRRNNLISISRRLKQSTHRFTSAHEIGHWVMHPGEIFHRDRPLDAPSSHLGHRDSTEIQADCFAAFFLMPRKLVSEHFVGRFNTECFSFTADQIFLLGFARHQSLKASSLSTLAKARILASAELYSGNRFLSLADEFRVSTEAMAIQLRDLGLVM